MGVGAGLLSLPTDIILPFADGSYKFALLLPQQIELEKSCGYIDAAGNQRRKGAIELYADLIAGVAVIEGEVVCNPHLGRASAFDCREVIRLGLTGGGKGEVNGAEVNVSAIRAKSLVETYVDTAPIVERWTLALAILRAAVEGYDPPKKAAPAKAPAAKRQRKPRSA
ncbi:gene transfer agent family protein [Sphingomonas montanisoli]|uniref:Gene transfer agent family protein n=1 Tax=Sphingomonas montanisoli TaxID=2606412 RepID=A0A5D9C147_9SPHN|nr:gene transfer agent family protein [Sphingomonas montanisoli]